MELDPADIVLRNCLLKYLSDNAQPQQRMPHQERKSTYQAQEQHKPGGPPMNYSNPPNLPHERNADTAMKANVSAYSSKPQQAMMEERAPKVCTVPYDEKVLANPPQDHVGRAARHLPGQQQGHLESPPEKQSTREPLQHDPQHASAPTPPRVGR